MYTSQIFSLGRIERKKISVLKELRSVKLGFVNQLNKFVRKT